MPINLAQLRSFHAVARLGGITAAAQALGVSRPAVTMQIKALEDDVGHALFVRRGHAFELNEVGRQLLPTVGTLARLLREADALVDRLRDGERGGLRIGACAPFVLVPTVAAFRDRHPGVRIEASIANSAELTAAVAGHALDLGVATFRSEPAGADAPFHSLALVGQSVRAVVAGGHRWAQRGRVPLRELADELAILREPGSMTRSLVADALAEAGVSLGQTLEFGSREAVKEAVAQGLGVGFVLDREIGPDPRLATLEIAGARPGSLSATEYLFCHRDLAAVGLVAAFLETARALWQTAPAAALAGE